MFGKWVSVNLYRQPPVAGFVASARMAGRLYYALLMPTRVGAPLDVRLFGLGASSSMTVLTGGVYEAIRINHGGRIDLHQLPCVVPTEPTIRAGLN